MFDDCRPLVRVNFRRSTPSQLEDFVELAEEANVLRLLHRSIDGSGVLVSGVSLEPVQDCGFYLPAVAVPAALNVLEHLINHLLLALPAANWGLDALSDIDVDYLEASSRPVNREEMLAQLRYLGAGMERITEGVGDAGNRQPIGITLSGRGEVIHVPDCLLSPVISALYQVCQLVYVTGQREDFGCTR